TQLDNYGESREQAIDAIIDQLNKHGMTVLGENQAITLERSREILELAVS
ncbi:NADH-dependent alcohol dehydrogenase, partial [Vibrio sp. 2132-1]|nr:NADH-dependent alcohol dehydrogenase [Vibrio sp. 2132-1]